MHTSTHIVNPMSAHMSKHMSTHTPLHMPTQMRTYKYMHMSIRLEESPFIVASARCPPTAITSPRILASSMAPYRPSPTVCLQQGYDRYPKRLPRRELSKVRGACPTQVYAHVDTIRGEVHRCECSVPADSHREPTHLRIANAVSRQLEHLTPSHGRSSVGLISVGQSSFGQSSVGQSSVGQSSVGQGSVG